MKSAGKSKKNKPVRDPAKEKLFKEISEQLAKKGFTVRREKLKQGYGWKVVSGACQALGQRLIFVDQRMTQDDQIAFLQTRLKSIDSNELPEDGANPST